MSAGDPGRPMVRVLSVLLDQRPHAVEELARRAELTEPVVIVVVARLAAAAWVVRVPATDRAGGLVVRLTAHGRRSCRRYRQAFAAAQPPAPRPSRPPQSSGAPPSLEAQSTAAGEGSGHGRAG